MTANEYRDWLEYFRYEPLNVQEVQMALLLALKVNSKENKVTYEDFMISRTEISKPESEESTDAAALDLTIRQMFS